MWALPYIYVLGQHSISINYAAAIIKCVCGLPLFGLHDGSESAQSSRLFQLWGWRLKALWKVKQGHMQTFRSYNFKVLRYRYHYWGTNVLHYQYSYRSGKSIALLLSLLFALLLWPNNMTRMPTNMCSYKMDIIIDGYFTSYSTMIDFQSKIHTTNFGLWFYCFFFHSTVIRSMGILSP